MQIISGIYKGKKIELTKKAVIRPTMAKVREAVFNIITHSKLLYKDIKEIKFLDLFCGSGIMGIEALSRGAKQAIFIDIDTSSCILNIANFQLQDKTTILNKNILTLKNSSNYCRTSSAFPINSASDKVGDFEDPNATELKHDTQNSSSIINNHYSFDIVYIDPPYNLEADINKILKRLYNNQWINQESLIIIEHSKTTDIAEKISPENKINKINKIFIGDKGDKGDMENNKIKISKDNDNNVANKNFFKLLLTRKYGKSAISLLALVSAEEGE